MTTMKTTRTDVDTTITADDCITRLRDGLPHWVAALLERSARKNTLGLSEWTTQRIERLRAKYDEKNGHEYRTANKIVTDAAILAAHARLDFSDAARQLQIEIGSVSGSDSDWQTRFRRAQGVLWRLAMGADIRPVPMVVPEPDPIKNAEDFISRVKSRLPDEVIQVLSRDQRRVRWGLGGTRGLDEWTPERLAQARAENNGREHRVIYKIIRCAAILAANARIDLSDGSLSSWEGRLASELGADLGIWHMHYDIAINVLSRMASGR